MTNKQGYLPGYGQVWFDPNGIANILSLSNVKKRYKVQYNSENDDVFIVTMAHGATREFKCADMGLYYFDMAEETNAIVHASVFTLTVEEQKA
jgi:hypothetical protein